MTVCVRFLSNTVRFLKPSTMLKGKESCSLAGWTSLPLVPCPLWRNPLPTLEVKHSVSYHHLGLWERPHPHCRVGDVICGLYNCCQPLSATKTVQSRCPHVHVSRQHRTTGPTKRISSQNGDQTDSWLTLKKRVI